VLYTTDVKNKKKQHMLFKEVIMQESCNNKYHSIINMFASVQHGTESSVTVKIEGFSANT